MRRSVAVLGVLVAGLAVRAAWGADIQSPSDRSIPPEFDILRVHVDEDGPRVAFSIHVAGEAGARIPDKSGQVHGAPVYAYIWTTNLDTALAGFGEKQGTLALAVTAHPDFDDEVEAGKTPDGKAWHAHWLVLVPGPECGSPDALKVKDIPAGAKQPLPKSWPKLPILISSPNYRTTLSASTVDVRVPEQDLGTGPITFDGLTAELHVSKDGSAPFLCVTKVFDDAGGGLHMAGRFDR